MADYNKKSTSAQNSLGQLFVEFGSKGLGGLTKGLYGLSAKFLLAKNAAQQAISPMIDFTKRTSQGITDLSKISLMSNIPLKQLFDMKDWAKANRVDFDNYINQIMRLQQAATRMKLGDVQSIKGFQLLGIDPTSVDPEKNPLEFMNLVRKRVLELYKTQGGGARAVTGLNYLGLDPELIWAFARANKQVERNVHLTQDQIKKQAELADKWADVTLKWGRVWDKILTNPLTFRLIDSLSKTADVWLRILDDKNKKNKNQSLHTISELSPFYQFGDSLGKSLIDTLKGEDNIQKSVASNTDSVKEIVALNSLPDVTSGILPSKVLNNNTIYNITNNNNLNDMNELASIDYITRQQAEYNNIRNNNNRMA